MGLSTSGAINLFIKQTILERALPFKPRAKTREERYNDYFNSANVTRLESSLNNFKSNNFIIKNFDDFVDEEDDEIDLNISELPF